MHITTVSMLLQSKVKYRKYKNLIYLYAVSWCPVSAKTSILMCPPRCHLILLIFVIWIITGISLRFVLTDCLCEGFLVLEVCCWTVVVDGLCTCTDQGDVAWPAGNKYCCMGILSCSVPLNFDLNWSQGNRKDNSKW